MDERVSSRPNPESTTTLLLGPAGLSAECWQFARSDGVPVDYPGLGKRERRPGWTPAAMARELVDVHPGQFEVMGVSTGVAVALNLLTHHAERIRSAILIGCGNMVVADVNASQIEHGLSEVRKQADLALREGMKAIVEPTLAHWFSPYALRAGLPGVRYARDSLQRTDPEVWRDGVLAEAACGRISVAALQSVKPPVTIVGAMHEYSGSVSGSARLHAAIPRSRFEVWSASAMMHLEQPEFIQTIIDRHRIWAANGYRVEQPLGTSVWLHLSDGPLGCAA